MKSMHCRVLNVVRVSNESTADDIAANVCVFFFVSTLLPFFSLPSVVDTNYQLVISETRIDNCRKIETCCVTFTAKFLEIMTGGLLTTHYTHWTHLQAPFIRVFGFLDLILQFQSSSITCSVFN